MVAQGKGLFWLASYPKSGNTWFRIFLANLLNPTAQSVDLNNLAVGVIASCRTWVDQSLGFDSALLSHDEIDALRPAVYSHYSTEYEQVAYHKIHDAYAYVDDQPMIPVKNCLGAIYFIRNPLDVAISFANHSSSTIDKAIASMGDNSFTFCKGRYRQFKQLRQRLFSWSMHVNSWLEAPNLNLLVLRYEEMKKFPQESFSKAAEFLQLATTPEKIAQAIAATEFDKLQQLEAKTGFNEKPAKVERFFRKGIVGDWQNTLTASQIQQIIHDHREVMRKFGYLDENNQPLVGYER